MLLLMRSAARGAHNIIFGAVEDKEKLLNGGFYRSAVSFFRIAKNISEAVAKKYFTPFFCVWSRISGLCLAHRRSKHTCSHFSWSRSFQIRNLAGSRYGSGKIIPDPVQLRNRNKIEVKLFWNTHKIWQFLNKNARFKNIISFFFMKSLHLVIVGNLKHLQDGNTKLKSMLKILEKNHVGSGTGSGHVSETNWKVGSIRIRKKPFRIHNTACTYTRGTCLVVLYAEFYRFRRNILPHHRSTMPPSGSYKIARHKT